MATVVVVMPTFNEAGNIGRMIDILAGKIFPKIKNHKMLLLVVDSSSPDGTGKVVKEKMKKYPAVKLLETAKEGLGMAYTRGFHYAIDKLKADGIMEMDADFQHDPNDVPRFLAEFDKGYDYILGSRYIKGGSIPKDWGFKRKFLSIVGNLFFRVTLFEWPVHDLTCGFRLSRVKSLLGDINFERAFSRSYSYKVRLLYEMQKRDAKIKEIPNNFVERKKGWSKMDSEDFIESLKVIPAIWADRLGLSR